MEKITKREIYESIISYVSTGEMKYDKDVYIDFCQKEIEALEKKALKAKEASAKKKAESDEILEAVFEVLSETDFESIKDITAHVEIEDITTSKVIPRLTSLVKAGKAEKSEIEVAGGEGQKKRKVAAYRKSV